MFIFKIIFNKSYWEKVSTLNKLKIYYGCGNVHQPGYINIDIRWTPQVDLVGDLKQCVKYFKGRCEEVYISHVLEHYGSPGKQKRMGKNSVYGALQDIYVMLKADGIVRIAVPDFSQLCKVYLKGNIPLHPKIAGRILGEQDYIQNYHRCVFDQLFLEECLKEVGFNGIRLWNNLEITINKDASFDMLDGTPTSLNVMAYRPA